MTGFTPIEGHCQCGAVAYRIESPPHDFYHCHCSMCRRCHGTLFATYAVVPRDKLVVLKGDDNLSTYSSSKGVHRRFCKTCGCQMFIDIDDTPDIRYYCPGTADGHPGHEQSAEKHIFVGSKVSWYRLQDDLPKHHEY